MFGTRPFIVNPLARLRLTAPRAVSRLLAATLFPPRCCLCGFEGAGLDLDLCKFCFTDLPWVREPTAGRVVALRFEHPVDDLIRALKYRGELANARVLGALLAAAVRNRGVELPKLLVPVPLHDARLCERGFNQAAALARYAGRALEIPFARSALRRVRDTPTQTALDEKARRRNVRDAFVVAGVKARERLLAAGHVALVDDVMTTGSTLAEARGLLLEAGVRRVDVWAVARTRA
jgi:ComF family protein